MNWLKRNINIQWLVSVVVVFLLVACGEDNETSKKEFDISQYVGTYKGTWTNNTTGTTGPVLFKVANDQASQKAILTLDFDGKYLGLDDPPAATLTGYYDTKGARVQGKSDLFGEYDVTIDIDGKIVGVMKQLANGTIPEMTYTGIITKDKLEADYVVRLADGKVMNSILRVQKQDTEYK